MALSLNDINAGELLLRELCSFFNHEAGYDIIEDVQKIPSDIKQELLRFINKKTNGDCEFQLRALNRLIEQAKNGDLMGIIPSSNATLCTICYVVLKRRNATLKFEKQTNHSATHGQPFYAVDFKKEFIEPLITSDTKISPVPKQFHNSCWYLFINVVYNDTSYRKTGRKILKFYKEGDLVKANYYSTNSLQPDWTGQVKYDSSKGHLHIYLKTDKNILRNMTMVFSLPQLQDIQTLEGDISYTFMKEMDKEIETKIIITKADCNSELNLKEYEENETDSIVEINNKLKQVKAKVKSVLPSHKCHDCEDG